jgi:hypothetical protein
MGADSGSPPLLDSSADHNRPWIESGQNSKARMFKGNRQQNDNNNKEPMSPASDSSTSLIHHSNHKHHVLSKLIHQKNQDTKGKINNYFEYNNYDVTLNSSDQQLARDQNPGEQRRQQSHMQPEINDYMPYQKAKIIRMPINESRQSPDALKSLDDDRPIKPSPNQQFFGNLDQFMSNAKSNFSSNSKTTKGQQHIQSVIKKNMAKKTTKKDQNSPNQTNESINNSNSSMYLKALEKSSKQLKTVK